VRAKESLESIGNQLEDAITDLRRVVYNLRPPALDEFGLVKAIELQVERLTCDRDGLIGTVVSSGVTADLPAATEVAALRIATEAVANVVKHADAQRCRVEIFVGRDLELRIADDGRGLGDDHPVGVGLSSMRERAAEVGGTCTIESSNGTEVRVVLPIGDKT
jgi:signal transduction histidine kinase